MATQPPFSILCVDDQADNLLSLATLLECEGYRVRTAASGREALAAARGVDLVILDVQLPDVNGFEICRQLKAGPATALVPVILLSGVFTRSEDKVEGLEVGGDAYFTKPADPRELLGQVKALLRIRKAELALHEQARILDQIHDAIIATDLEGRIIRWNKGAERLFGYPAAEVLGQSVALVYPPGEAETGFARIVAALQESGKFELEKRVRTRSGEDRFVHCSLSFLYDEQGEATGMIGYNLDVTERRRLEEQFRQAQKMEAVGRLAGGVAHDFNNLLTVINGFADLLQGELPEGAPERNLTREILKAGERAAGLTQQLLAFSRRQILQPRVVDLNFIIRDMEVMLRRTIGEDVDLDVRLAPDLGRVKADPGQLGQVLLNLVVNAREAMPEGGSLTLATHNVEVDGAACREHPEAGPGPYVVLAVRDTGCGMTPQVRARVFEPFFTTKEVGQGSGLGLATVHGIVHQSGGFVEVESAVDAGTCFKVYLPRLAATESDDVLPSQAYAPRGTETILLVEDEDAVRRFTALALRGSGYTVLTAEDGEEALRVATSYTGPIHLLVTDVVMPRLGGRQLAERLRASHPEARVLYVSGYTDDAVIRHGVHEAGANFLHKPFAPSELARKVRAVLDEPLIAKCS